MAIEAGQQLLHYRLIEKIGEGGMGVVWKASDTSLDREVAIKVLPDDFAADPDRLTRFEREAKLLASLNDPHIAAIYGLHKAEGIQFLAMELVEGESLDARIARIGALDQDEARSIAMQVAAALEGAHNQGVVHRDLKPANIQIAPNGKAKVLDFGLAKAMPAGGSSNPSIGTSASVSPTRTSAGTVAGVILGTAGYMSPEQARGKPVDRRTDIWAFGCVLFEMLTGKTLFGGETVSDSIARILEREPDIDSLPPTVSGSIRELLRRCLAKDVQKRLRDAGDALLVLEDWMPGATETTPAEFSSRPRRLWPLAAVAFGGLIIGAAVMFGVRPAPPEAPLRKFQMQIDGLQWGFNGGVFPSPDGHHLAYLQDDRVMIRHLGKLKAREADAIGPVTRLPIFWSPDSSYFGYQKEKRLWKVPLAGGAPESICSLPETGGILGAAWGKDGRIVFSVWRGGMYAVSAAGGTPELLLAVDHEKVIDYHTVDLLPDGTVIFDVHAAGTEAASPIQGISVLEGSTPRIVLPDQSNFTYSPTGHLLYTERIEGDKRIMAVPFSVSTREVTGEPLRVIDDGLSPMVTDTGDLAFVREDGARSFQLTWVDRKGEVRGVAGEPNANLIDPALSPDGTQIAVSFEADDRWDIWVVSTGAGAPRRLTFHEEPLGAWQIEMMAAWTPDGKDVVFSRHENLVPTAYAVAADGSGNERKLFPGQDLHVSQDGRYVVFHTHDLASDDDLWIAEIPDGGRIDDAETRKLMEGSKRHRQGRISPAGHILAYELNDGDETDIYLTRFPSGEGRWQVSTGGGRDPRWSPDGSHLYFLDDDLALNEVAVQTTPSMELSRPKLLFATDTNSINLSRGYDVAADGRLLVVRTVSDDRKRYVVFVQNWLAEIKGD